MKNSSPTVVFVVNEGHEPATVCMVIHHPVWFKGTAPDKGQFLSLALNKRGQNYWGPTKFPWSSKAERVAELVLGASSVADARVKHNMQCKVVECIWR